MWTKCLSITTGALEGCQVVVVRGELDELTAPQLEAAITMCADGWPLVIDIVSVEFVSSAGLHVLLKDRDRQIALVCQSRNVERLFEIVGSNGVPAVFDELDEAIDSLSRSDQVATSG